RRWVEFGSNAGNVNTYTWADFIRIKTNKQLDDEKATHEEVEALQNLIMPTGIISMWSGSIQNIPSGWALCNGANGTPNLQNRFVVGAGQQYSVGAAGGNTHKTLGIENLPAHKHTIDASRNRGNTSSGAYLAQQEQYQGDGVIRETKPTGGNQSFDLRPPYYALAYIMKL
ncbi:MAG: hypothetical protein PHW82_14865, partial [Bacteroidales bacterium]|nr:hypothetical protein [Bacteroidales bacterium]